MDAINNSCFSILLYFNLIHKTSDHETPEEILVKVLKNEGANLFLPLSVGLNALLDLIPT